MAKTKLDADVPEVEDVAEETVAEETIADEASESEAPEETDAARESVEIEAEDENPAAVRTEEPAHELSRPRIIDINQLLEPISQDAPAGEYLRYSGDYDEIGEARRADEDLALGAWQTELKVADFKKTIELATMALKSKTKDLQIAAWLCEAVTAEYGFAGLRDGLKLVSGLISTYWETGYPGIGDGDESGRANALAWLDREAGFLLKKAALTEGEGWGYIDYLDSKTFDFPESVETLGLEEQAEIGAQREKAETENRATASKWKQAASITKRLFYEELKVAIDECNEEYNSLNRAIEEKFDRNQAPGLPEIKKALAEIGELTLRLLEQKRLEEPDAAYDTGDSGAASDGSSGSGGAMSGMVQNREDALRRLTEIAAFFRHTEPHSPVAYLVSRAVKWGHMPLDTWLQDVIKDENILFQLRQTLGFNTTPPGDSQAAEE